MEAKKARKSEKIEHSVEVLVAPGLRRCTACGTACYPEDRYCPSCGEQMQPSCGICGASHEHPVVRFCPQCGHRVDLRRVARASSLFLLLLLLLSTSAALTLKSQGGGQPIIVTTNVVPPYDPDLSVWERNPNRLLVTMQNTDPTTSHTIRLGGSVTSDDGSVSITLRDDFAAAPITLAPGATRTLNARQTGLFDPNAVRVVGADRDEIARTRRLPEGSYRACLQALDFVSLAPLSAGAPTGCASFFIREADLPRPFFPACKDIVVATPMQSVTLQWTRPSLSGGGLLVYDLVLVPVTDGRSPEEAILSATDPLFFRKEGIATNFYAYGPLDRPLTIGTTYAWRVRATTSGNTASFPNDGWSEICSFTYGSVGKQDDLADCDPPKVVPLYPGIPASTAPAAIPRIPFRSPPIAVVYNPFCATLKSMTSNLQIRSGDSLVESWSRSYTYPTTLYEMEAAKAGGVPKTKDVLSEKNIARHSPFHISRPPVAGTRALPPGVPLRWNAQVTLQSESGSGWTRQVAGALAVGMGRPLPSLPVDESRMPLPIVFRFRSAKSPPSTILLPIDSAIWSAERGREYRVDSVGRVAEVWMLEVSPTPFSGTDTILYAKTGKLTAKVLMKQRGASGATNAFAKVYRAITDSATGFVPTGGTYYWRVKWLVDNDTSRLVRNRGILSDTAAYAWSAVHSFSVDTTLDSASSGIDAAECLRLSPVLPVNGGDWIDNLRPQFRLAVTPTIDPTKVTGGRLELWALDTTNVMNPQLATNRAATRSWRFAGSGWIDLDTSSASPTIDVDLTVASNGTPVWIGERDTRYAWRLTLRYDSVVRLDSVICQSDSTISRLGTFRIAPTLPAIPDSLCVLLAPESPAHNGRISDSLPVFSIRATPLIDTSGIDRLGLRIWRMTTKNESPAKVAARQPSFEHVVDLGQFGASGGKIGNVFVDGDLTSLLTIHDVNDTTGGRTPSQRFVAKQDSSYLWQVSLVRATGRTLREDGTTCEGAPDTIHSAYGLFRYDTTGIDSLAPCPDGCILDTVLSPTPRKGDIELNERLKIGRFDLSLTSIDDPSPASFSGEGEIMVKWLRMRVEVGFSGLRVNAQNQVVAGVIRAKQEPTVTMPSEAMNAAGVGAWTQEGILAGYGAATAATRLLANMVSGSAVSLPIGFDATTTGRDGEAEGGGLAIGITDMTFTPTGAFLTALAKAPLPVMGKGRGLGFGIRNLCFTPTSFTSGAERNVFLAADAGYRDGDSWGFKVLAPTIESGITTDSGTYLTWDCRGVAAFRIAAAVEFPRTWMVPIGLDGEVDTDPTRLVTATASFLWRRPDLLRRDSVKLAAEAPVSSTTILAAGATADTGRTKLTKSGFHVLATGRIEKFAPANAPDLHVEVANITFDWSDFENPAGMVYPSSYTGEMTNRWRGFYLRGAYVRLPNAVTHRDSTAKRLAIEAEYLMVDRSGLSFRARVDNLLPIDDGRASGWALGIDRTALEVVNNIPRELSLDGEVRLPIADSGIAYNATLQYVRQLRPDSGTVATSSGTTTPSSGADSSRYVNLPKLTLTLAPKDTIGIPMWGARANLAGNVTVSLAKKWVAAKSGSASTSAASTAKSPRLRWVVALGLNAGLRFGGKKRSFATTSSGTDAATGNEPEVDVAGISVQGFAMQSVVPIVSSFGTWMIGGKTVAGEAASSSPASPSAPSTPSSTATTGQGQSQPKMGGFPLSVTHITPGTSTNSDGDDVVGLTFDVNLHLLPSERAGISGTTTLGIFGELSSDTSGGQRFDYSHTELRKITVDALFGPAVKLKGVVEFYKGDETYGSGFYGAVDATIIDKLNAKMIAQFGTVKVGSEGSERDHRYGLVDFAALFNPGIPLGPSGAAFYGGGGGVWFGMKRTGEGPAMPLESAKSPSKFRIGESLSGYIYKPDPDVLFGARIMATLGTSNPNVFNADIALEIEVTPSWGLGRISLTGDGYGMTKNFPNRDDADLRATVDLSYRAPQKEFHGLFRMRVKKGDFLEVKGDVVMHFDPSTWYVKFGEPTNRITATIAKLASVQAYLMFGNKLPPPPDPPGSITAKLGKIAADRDFSVEGGKGFAFGAQAGFDTGDKQFLIFYGRVHALVGFDASILKYPADVACDDVSPIGVNGWYGMLQMYAELGAEIGIKVKLGFATVQAEIFSAQAWALLKAGAPNPTWAAGAIAGEYSVLGGLISGSFKFEFDVGNKCEPSRGVLDGLELITDIQPVDKQKDVDPVSAPQVAFGLNVEKSFRTVLADVKGTYRLHIEELELTTLSGSSWKQVAAERVIDRTNTSATLYPREMLAGQRPHRLVARVTLQRLVSGRWQDFRVDGKRITEQRSVQFMTGDPPDRIPEQNIAYTWPISGQRYFMKDEGGYSSRGGHHIAKVVLKQGQAYLFSKDAKAESLDILVRVTAVATGEEKFYEGWYDRGRRLVGYRLPKRDMQKGSRYLVDVVRRETYPESGGTVENERDLYQTKRDKLWQDVYNATLKENSGITGIVIAKKRADEAVDGISATTTDRSLIRGSGVSGVVDKTMTTYGFGTSRFASYKAKLADGWVSGTLLSADQTVVFYRHRSENFDDFDLRGFTFVRNGRSELIPARYTVASRDRSRRWHRDMVIDQIETPKKTWEEWMPMLRDVRKDVSWFWYDDFWRARRWYDDRDHAMFSQSSRGAPPLTLDAIRRNVPEPRNYRTMTIIQTQGADARRDYDLMMKVEASAWFVRSREVREVDPSGERVVVWGRDLGPRMITVAEEIPVPRWIPQYGDTYYIDISSIGSTATQRISFKRR